MFSFAESGSTPNRSAIWAMRSGRNVPSVSMYATFPSAPPMSRGSWATTDMVCESWVLPQRNSPKTSLMLMLWKPPPRIESNCLLPVEILMTLFRW
ncbi:hypothetical protein BDW69DRAFT_162184 [Aspergillus filifer]